MGYPGTMGDVPEYFDWQTGELRRVPFQSQDQEKIFRCVDIWNFESESGESLEPFIGTARMLETDLKKRMRKARPDGIGKMAGGLRIIICRSLRDMSQRTRNDIIEQFQLDPDTALFSNSGSHPSSIFEASARGEQIRYSFCSIGALSLSASHQTSTLITAVLIETQIVELEVWADRYCGHLKEGPALAASPMYPLFTLAQTHVSGIRNLSNRQSDVLHTIEYSTGHSWHAEAERSAQLLSEDMMKLNADLAQCRCLLADYQLCSARVEHLLQLISQQLKAAGTCPTYKKSREAARTVLQEKIALLTVKLPELMGLLRFYQERSQIQQYTLYNLQNRQDATLNIRIAEFSSQVALASKRDSDSMKTIAVLTMAFLPGTWVAALFAVPMFDWSATPGGPVLGGRFWIYWAVTLPLTLAVLASWWAWKEWRHRRNAVEEAQALKRARGDSRGKVAESDAGIPGRDLAIPGALGSARLGSAGARFCDDMELGDSRAPQA